MLLLELAALAIVALYVVGRAAEEAAAGPFLSRLLLVSLACWIGEESAISLYKFYSYSPAWRLFLGHVPVTVILIWPVIIHSAWDIAAQLFRSKGKLVVLGSAAIVCTDASLIEPVAVNAGLWSWNEPGIFQVPPIGILGWAYFALFCTLLLEGERRQKGSRRLVLLIPILPPAGTHLLLLMTWWGALRWVNVPVNQTFAAGIAWSLSLLLAYAVMRRRVGVRLKRMTLLLRVPAALLVFLLLALHARGSTLLVPYGLAFILPYLCLMAQQYLIYPPCAR